MWGRTVLACLLILGIAPIAPGQCGDWEYVPSPNGGAHLNTLHDVAALAQDSVWVVGRARDGIFELDQGFIMRGNGMTWELFPNPSPPNTSTELSGVAPIASDDVWAVGTSRVEGLAIPWILHYDGVEWSEMSDLRLVPSALEAVIAISHDDLWAVGRSGYSEHALALHGNGESWQAIPVPAVGTVANSLEDIDAYDASGIWAVGHSSDGFESFNALIAHWNGVQWTSFSAPSPGYRSRLHGVSVLARNAAWAVGEVHLSTNTTQPLVLRWDGTLWHVETIPLFDDHAVLEDVVALGPDDVWAVGTHQTGEGLRPLYLHYDGNTWNPSPYPLVPSSQAEHLLGVTALDNGEVWAVGYQLGMGMTASLTEHYIPPTLIRVGDVNGDEVISIDDPIFILAYLFLDGTMPDPLRAADVNGDDYIDSSDAVYLLNFLFLNGPEPVGFHCL